jgi:hypothetical protein
MHHVLLLGGRYHRSVDQQKDTTEHEYKNDYPQKQDWREQHVSHHQDWQSLSACHTKAGWEDNPDYQSHIWQHNLCEPSLGIGNARMKVLGIPGLTFSWQRAIGLTTLRRRVALKTGIPTTYGGLERKVGRLLLNLLFKEH